MISNRRIRVYSYLLILLLLMGVMTGCGSSAQGTATTAKSEEKRSIILATTTSTQDSGLLDSIIPAFEQKTGIQVKVVAVGTGQAIQLGKDGNADVLLVHARKSEDEFVASGFGVNAYDVMVNQFLIVGPKDDPAGIKGMATAPEAFKAIAMKKSAFISRGDDSGTHKKEQSIWDSAGLKPEGSWYLSAGQGMGATLQMADEKNAYALADEATYLSRKGNLVVLKEGDASLLNPYGVIQVKSTEKVKEVDQFIQFLVGAEGQKLIGEFGKAEYGKGLFVSSAKKR